MEDFRVHAILADDGQASSLRDDLRAATSGAQGLAGVMVTRDGRRVYLYADTEAQARSAERLVHELVPSAEVAVTRWHPVEEAWKDAALPLPATPDEEATELAAREVAELAEAAAEGDFDWHVVVHLPKRGEAVALEERLAEEGLAVKRRWRYLVVGVLTEERATELADRLGEELPASADVRIEAVLADVERSPLQFLPF